jgi:hypothetical protein
MKNLIASVLFAGVCVGPVLAAALIQLESGANCSEMLQNRARHRRFAAMGGVPTDAKFNGVTLDRRRR